MNKKKSTAGSNKATIKPEIPQDQTSQTSPDQAINTKNLENSPVITTQKIKKAKNRTYNRYRIHANSKYKPSYCHAIIEYFTQDLYTERIKSRITSKSGNVIENLELIPNAPKWFGSFAYSIGTTQATLRSWTKIHPEFLSAFTRAKELQLEHIRSLGNMGLFNSNFATFTMKNISDWRDKKDLELSGKVDSQIFFAEMLVNSQDALENERKVAGSRLN